MLILLSLNVYAIFFNFQKKYNNLSKTWVEVQIKMKRKKENNCLKFYLIAEIFYLTYFHSTIFYAENEKLLPAVLIRTSACFQICTLRNAGWKTCNRVHFIRTVCQKECYTTRERTQPECKITRSTCLFVFFPRIHTCTSWLL